MVLRTKKREYKIHLFHVFIIALTAVKVVLMALFSSDYQNLMFMPFVNTFIEHFGEKGFNIYNFYYNNDFMTPFPYPPLMLYILSVTANILNSCGEVNLLIANFLFKLPILVFDFIGLIYIMKIFPNSRKCIGLMYYASPIVVYAGYMHGQLDIIPTTFLIVSIYYLIGKTHKQIISALFLAASIACKLHILAVLPIVYIYYYKKEGVWKAVQHLFITALISFGIMIPFMGTGFISAVLFNKEQGLLTQVFFEYVNIKVYLPIVAVLIIYLKTFSLNYINRELFISFCGILFASFLAFIPPMPGWYIWIVPFITMFFINVKDNRFFTSIIYAALNFLYLVYFVFFHSRGRTDLYFLETDLSFLKVNNDVLGNGMFTLLVGTLLYVIYLMYNLGIKSNSLYKRRNLPFTIGISGDSGSGKSTLIKLLEECLGCQNLLFIEGDGDHKWERGEKMWDEYTHLNPKANYLYRQAMDISMLRMGSPVIRVNYDHDTGKFSKEYKIKPNKYILMCGLHSLYLPQMRKNLDLKIFMDIDENLRRFWKIHRDTEYRGYSKEKTLAQIEERMEDAQKHIIPQKEYADLIIKYFDDDLNDYMIDDYEETIKLQITLSADINLEPLSLELLRYKINTEYDYSEDLMKQIVIFSGEGLNSTTISFDELAESFILQLNEITVQSLESNNNINGIIKLILLKVISYKMQGDK